MTRAVTGVLLTAALGDHHVIYVPTYSHVSHGENRV